MSKFKLILIPMLYLLTSISAMAQTYQITPVDEPNVLSLLAIAVGILVMLKAKNKK